MDKARGTDVGNSGINALEVLRRDWGSAYQVEGSDDNWRARRLDGLGEWIEADSPDSLRHQIFDDYSLKPVRPQGPGT
jgi:hypothetical protein